jgi:hypothetical protein
LIRPAPGALADRPGAMQDPRALWRGQGNRSIGGVMEDYDRIEIMREALNKILALVAPDEWDELRGPGEIRDIARAALVDD